jgi:hypothetical protein
MVAIFVIIYFSGHSISIDKNFHFAVSSIDSSGTAMQVNSIQTTVNVRGTSGNPESVTLSAEWVKRNKS